MTAQILSVRFDGVTMDQAVDRALALLGQGRCAYVCTPNPEIVWDCRKNAGLRAAIAGADMTLPDGVGIVWASRVLGCPVPERVTGYDFLLALLARFQGRLFLLGGKPGVAQEAAEAIARRFPAVTVCGCRSGYFDESENAAVLTAVEEAAPELLLVCMGSPRQEIWMAANRDRLPGVGLMAGLGGCLDVLSGRVRRAPEVWIRLRLEWLYRLLREPSRWKRQMRLPAFALAVLAERVRKTGLR